MTLSMIEKEGPSAGDAPRSGLRRSDGPSNPSPRSCSVHRNDLPLFAIRFPGPQPKGRPSRGGSAA